MCNAFFFRDSNNYMHRSSCWRLLFITLLMINDSTGRLTNDTSIRLKQFYVVPFPSIIGSNGDGSFTCPSGLPNLLIF